jgi:hypothetical protein
MQEKPTKPIHVISLCFDRRYQFLSKWIITFGIIILAGILPVCLYSQFEPDVQPHFCRFEDGKKVFNIHINLKANITPNKKIVMEITPNYSDTSGNLLDAKTIKKMKLRCDLITQQIKIKPNNYCALSNIGNTNLTLLNEKVNTIDFDLTKGIEFEQDLVISLPFVIFADKKEKNTTKDFKLNVIEKPKPSDEKDISQVETDAEKEKGQVDEKTAKNKKDKAGGGGAGDKGGAADADSISTEPLEERLTECKALYNEVHALYNNREETSISPEQIQKYRTKLDNIKTRFDGLLLKFSDVPKAKPIIASFDRHYETALDIFNALNKYMAQNENSVLSEKEKQIAKGEKQNKVLQIILIILGAILLGIVLFVLMKFVMKKVKKGFEKKMKRKATLELNKQKFKVTQQQNKLKV